MIKIKNMKPKITAFVERCIGETICDRRYRIELNVEERHVVKPFVFPEVFKIYVAY